jgi:hypothetical protein
MSRVILPFNHQPIVSDIKQGAFSIPLGQYARVVPISDDLNIDGVSACLGNATSGTIAFSSSSQLLVGTFSQPFYVSWSRNSGAGTLRLITNYSTNGTSGNQYLLTDTNQSGSYFVNASVFPLDSSIAPIAQFASVSGDGLVFLESSNNASNVTISICALHKPKEIWVTEGAALSGQRYIVELYNMLT